MTITESTTVADIASSCPSSVRIFQRHGIDFCYGGKTSLALACQEQGVPFVDVVRAIEASTQNAEPDGRDWNAEPLHFRALYHGLSELESAMQVHVHLENNILFPRALALTGLAASNR